MQFNLDCYSEGLFDTQSTVTINTYIARAQGNLFCRSISSFICNYTKTEAELQSDTVRFATVGRKSCLHKKDWLLATTDTKSLDDY